MGLSGGWFDAEDCPLRIDLCEAIHNLNTAIKPWAPTSQAQNGARNNFAQKKKPPEGGLIRQEVITSSLLQQEQQQERRRQQQVQQQERQHQQQVQQQERVQLQELVLLFYHMQPRQQLKELPKEVSLSCQLSFEGKVGLTISGNCHKLGCD